MTPIVKSESKIANRKPRRIGARLAAATLGLFLVVVVGVWPRIARQQEAVAIAKAAETFIPSVLVTPSKTVAGNAELLLPGNTEAINVASIYARANGYVRERMVDIGSVVKAGAALAIIESPELDQELQQGRASLEQTKAALEQATANLEQAKAGVNQARANVTQAEANEEIAASTDRRWARLVERGVLPKQAGDERRSAYLAMQAASEAARAALHTAEANVTSRTADLGAARANIDAQAANVRRLERLQGFERVAAPFDGVVTERKVERGDLVSAGSGSDRNLFTVAQASTLRIQVSVPQSYAVDLHAGQNAEVLVAERPGRKYTGKVARTAQALQVSSRTLLTEVQVDNSSGELLPGMYAQVKFSIPRSVPVVVIPADALLADSRGTRVAVVDANNRAHFRNVQVGRDRGTEVEVLSGLKGNEGVISNPPDMLADGSEVIVQRPQGGKQ